MVDLLVFIVSLQYAKVHCVESMLFDIYVINVVKCMSLIDHLKCFSI